MSQPKILVESAWRDALMELSALYVITTVGAVHLLSLNWLLAIVLGDPIADLRKKTANQLGLRKSPLA